MYRKIEYKPWESPIEQYAFPLRMLKRVVWSIVGAGGVTHDSEKRSHGHGFQGTQYCGDLHGRLLP